MSYAAIMSWLVELFSLRRPRDFLIKPPLTGLSFLVLYIGVLWPVLPGDGPGILQQTGLAALVFLPYLLLAFALVRYLDLVRAEISEMALTDPLTGLPNRRAFTAQVVARHSASVIGFLLILDADHFKRINDTYGHAMGDQCLRAITDRMSQTLETTANLGRIGGEEFAVFLPVATETEVRDLGHRLCRPIQVPLDGGKDYLRFTLSIGASETRPGEDLSDTFARADAALYAAKEAGRARLVVWHRSEMSLSA